MDLFAMDGQVYFPIGSEPLDDGAANEAKLRL